MRSSRTFLLGLVVTLNDVEKFVMLKLFLIVVQRFLERLFHRPFWSVFMKNTLKTHFFSLHEIFVVFLIVFGIIDVFQGMLQVPFFFL